MSDISTKEAFKALWANTKKTSKKASDTVSDPEKWKRVGGYFSNIGRAFAGRVEPLKSDAEKELERAMEMAKEILLQQED